MRRWEELAQMFKLENYRLNCLSSEPLLTVHLQAGISSLKTPYGHTYLLWDRQFTPLHWKSVNTKPNFSSIQYHCICLIELRIGNVFERNQKKWIVQYAMNSLENLRRIFPMLIISIHVLYVDWVVNWWMKTTPQWCFPTDKYTVRRYLLLRWFTCSPLMSFFFGFFEILLHNLTHTHECTMYRH